MPDLRLVKDTPDPAIIKILEDSLARANTGDIKAIILTLIDRTEHVDVRCKWVPPISKLAVVGSLRVANNLMDRILCGQSDTFKEDVPMTVRKATEEEKQCILEKEIPVYIAKVKDQLRGDFIFLVVPKHLPPNIKHPIALEVFEQERLARGYCHHHQLVCDLPIVSW